MHLFSSKLTFRHVAIGVRKNNFKAVNYLPSHTSSSVKGCELFSVIWKCMVVYHILMRYIRKQFLLCFLSFYIWAQSQSSRIYSSAGKAANEMIEVMKSTHHFVFGYCLLDTDTHWQWCEIILYEICVICKQ